MCGAVGTQKQASAPTGFRPAERVVKQRKQLTQVNGATAPAASALKLVFDEEMAKSQGGTDPTAAALMALRRLSAKTAARRHQRRPNAAAAQSLRRLVQLAKVDAISQLSASLCAAPKDASPVQHFDLGADDSAALRHFDLSALQHTDLSAYFGESFDLTATGPEFFGLADPDESDDEADDFDDASPWAAL